MLDDSHDGIVDFSYEIEKLVLSKSLSYIDAVVYYCEKNDLEVEVIAKMVTGALKSKIKLEAEDLNFLPKSNTAKLPF
jgi:hypothetical protein